MLKSALSACFTSLFTPTTGACGGLMHSLVASKTGVATVRLLKTNPVNRLLQRMYNYQTASSLTHGRNLITLRDVIRGDTHTFEQAAFKAQPKVAYAKVGDIMEWTFEGVWHPDLGSGSPKIY